MKGNTCIHKIIKLITHHNQSKNMRPMKKIFTIFNTNRCLNSLTWQEFLQINNKNVINIIFVVYLLPLVIFFFKSLVNLSLPEIEKIVNISPIHIRIPLLLYRYCLQSPTPPVYAWG